MSSLSELIWLKFISFSCDLPILCSFQGSISICWIRDPNSFCLVTIFLQGSSDTTVFQWSHEENLFLYYLSFIILIQGDSYIFQKYKLCDITVVKIFRKTLNSFLKCGLIELLPLFENVTIKLHLYFYIKCSIYFLKFLNYDF